MGSGQASGLHVSRAWLLHRPLVPAVSRSPWLTLVAVFVSVLPQAADGEPDWSGRTGGF